MVFKSLQLLSRSKGPDEFWRKRKIFKLAAHFRGRMRNCYSMTIRAVHRSLQYTTKSREVKRKDLRELWETRLDAACMQHDITRNNLRDGLYKYDVHLDRKALSDVSIWEPRTFKALSNIAALKYNIITENTPKQIFLTQSPDDYVRTTKKLL